MKRLENAEDIRNFEREKQPMQDKAETLRTPNAESNQQLLSFELALSSPATANHF